ncbi:MAG: MOSC domain-containing protein [Planktomarina sp.]
MPALIPTDHYCTVTWLGAVMHRREMMIETQRHPTTLDIGWDGISGAAHTGATRPSDSRVKSQHVIGTEIKNVRQITMVSAEDLSHIAAVLKLDACNPEWLGANIVVEGLADFTFLPPSSRLQAENGTTLIVDMENRPCVQVNKTIERVKPGHGKGFKDAAKGRRGITASVERPGSVKIGDRFRLHVPQQRCWQGGTV